MKRKQQWWATVVVVLQLLVAPDQAQAEPSKTDQADQLFREGREAMKRKDFLGACNKFHASQKLDPAPGTALSIAECEGALERPAVAHSYYQQVIEQLPATDERAELAKRQRAELESRMGRVVVGNIPPKYSFWVELYSNSDRTDRVPTSPAAPLGVWAAPGTYHMAIVIKGVDKEVTLPVPGVVQVRAGEQKRVDYKPPGEQKRVDYKPPGEKPQEPPRKTPDEVRTGTKVALVGGVLVLGGGLLFSSGLGGRNPESHTWQNTGLALMMAGSASVLVGLLMNSHSTITRTTVRVQPWADPSVGLAGAAVGGAW